MTPDEYCQHKAARSGSSFYYSFRFLPDFERRAITALYAFCREVDDVVDDCSEAEVARRTLDWWREEIDRMTAGRPEHPVTRALLPAVQARGLAGAYFHEILDGMAMDLERFHYDTFSDLQLYLYRVAGVVGILSAEIFGYSHHRTLDYARDLGIAFQLTNILRDVREDAQRGRIYLPREDLQRFGVSPASVLSLQQTEALARLLEFEYRRTLEWYDKAFAALPEEDRPRQQAGLVMAAIYRTLLEEIREDGFRVMEHRILLTPLRKLWIAWQTHRRERRRARRRAVAVPGEP
ncbi:MAG: squalene synthase HpnD [Gammaproteobacteria bacterium]|nr:MAG: squalene synthase HpnD [Gammaproteobacteria bacterium]